MTRFVQTYTDLDKRFALHLCAINSDIKPAAAERLWQDIATRYNETTRAYHTMGHLEQLFAQFEKIKHYLREPHIVALALYYHDVIYDPTRADNELKSAKFAVAALNRYLNAEQCQRLYALIMMTANHQLDGNGTAENHLDLDAAYLLDMDLSILAAPWPEYAQYTQAIRQEYTHVPLADFCVGRIAVLESLLAHPDLYLTDYYHERLEKPARVNIEREIKLLLAS